MMFPVINERHPPFLPQSTEVYYYCSLYPEQEEGGGMETDASNLIHSLRIEYSNKLKTNRCGQVVFPLKSIDLNGSNLASKASPV